MKKLTIPLLVLILVACSLSENKTKSEAETFLSRESDYASMEIISVSTVDSIYSPIDDYLNIIQLYVTADNRFQNAIDNCLSAPLDEAAELKRKTMNSVSECAIDDVLSKAAYSASRPFNPRLPKNRKGVKVQLRNNEEMIELLIIYNQSGEWMEFHSRDIRELYDSVILVRNKYHETKKLLEQV